MARLGLVSAKMLKNWYERDRIKKAESILVHENSTVSSIVNKYPAQWVDGICKSLELNTKGRKSKKAKMIAEKLKSDIHDVLEKLPEKSLEALAFVLKKDGIVKYSQVSRRFDDEIGFWWNEHPRVSTVGMLRSHGLLYVGKKPFGDRLYKVALVPQELRETLTEALRKKAIIR